MAKAGSTPRAQSRKHPAAGRLIPDLAELRSPRSEMFFLEGLMQTLPTPAKPDGGAPPNSASRALPALERTSTGLGIIPRPLDVRPERRGMMRVKRARGTRSWWGAPRPAPPARGRSAPDLPEEHPRRRMNETAPRSKFSEIGDQRDTPASVRSPSASITSEKVPNAGRADVGHTVGPSQSPTSSTMPAPVAKAGMSSSCKRSSTESSG